MLHIFISLYWYTSLLIYASIWTSNNYLYNLFYCPFAVLRIFYPRTVVFVWPWPEVKVVLHRISQSDSGMTTGRYIHLSIACGSTDRHLPNDKSSDICWSMNSRPEVLICWLVISTERTYRETSTDVNWILWRHVDTWRHLHQTRDRPVHNRCFSQCKLFEIRCLYAGF